MNLSTFESNAMTFEGHILFTIPASSTYLLTYADAYNFTVYNFLTDWRKCKSCRMQHNITYSR